MRSLARLVLWRLGLVRIRPWASAEETAALARHARGKRRLAEIGVWEGGSTRVIRGVMDPAATLFAIDPFPKGRLGVSYQEIIAHGEASRGANGEVRWIRDRGAAAAADPAVRREPFDFVYIDADHSFEGLRADWEAWRPLIGDTVALHDVLDDPSIGSVRFAAAHIFTDPDFEVVERVKCMAVLRRRAG